MGTLPDFDAGPLPLAYLRYLNSLHMHSNALVVYFPAHLQAMPKCHAGSKPGQRWWTLLTR